MATRFQRRRFFLEITRNKNCLWLPCLLTDRDETNNIYRRMSIYVFYQVLVHLAMRFQRRRFFQKQELPVATMLVSESGRNEQSLQRTVHRCFLPSFGSFAHAVLEENIFLKNRPIRNKNCLRWPCLLTDRYEMCNLYRGLIINASCQVSVHLAKLFQRRRLKCEKLTDDGRQVMAKAHIAFFKVS